MRKQWRERWLIYQNQPRHSQPRSLRLWYVSEQLLVLRWWDSLYSFAVIFIYLLQNKYIIKGTKVPLFLNKIVFFCHANLSFSQNKVGIVVNRVQQTNLGFGLFHSRAFGQCALLLPFNRITVFSGNFTNYVGHYILIVLNYFKNSFYWSMVT